MSRPRPSTAFLAWLALAYALLGAAVIHAHLKQAVRREALSSATALVRRLGLTDLCLFTEARYTRHPTQADSFAAFQDHPGAREHFPSGSLVSPPRRVP
ncbi:MAG TPA: hypothetical protein VMT97_08440 [Terriglobales bacterium]|nr:hypothetical protein [Terriglobales bacterium]